MRNPVTRLSAAVVIVVAAGIAGVVMWTATGSGIALADVLAQVQQITAYMFQTTISVSAEDPNGQDMIGDMEGTTLISHDGGVQMVMKSVDPNSPIGLGFDMYMQPHEKTVTTLMHDMKQYMRMEFDDMLIEKARQEHYDPSYMLKEILECKYESLGRSIIDGVEVEGFETTDPDYEGGGEGPVDVKIWVDVKTQLPVRLEQDVETDGKRMHIVVHGFQWNYPVDADTFKPVIPPDYTTMFGDNLKMPPMDEQGAITGLKVCADLIGRYPEKLDFMTVASLASKLEDRDEAALKRQTFEEDDKDILALKQLIDDDQGLSWEEQSEKIQEVTKRIEERREAREEQIKTMEEHIKEMEEQVKETMDKVMPIQGAVMFYMTLVEERKDPAYYGNVVTPQNADKVLMRWKISDGQYRVIFGSLHAETVDAQTLAELEKDLPE